MSAYGKPQPPQFQSYDNTRTFPESTFAYQAPIYGQPLSQPSTTGSNFQDGTPITPMTYPSNPPRAAYDEQAGPYLNVGSTPIPEVKSFSPARGTKGTKVTVSITTLYELLTSSEPTFFLVFGQRKVAASLTKIGQQGAVCQYQVVAEVPQLSAIGWSSSQVAVSMFMEAGDGDVIAKAEVGKFTYIDVSNPGGAPQENSRKRKMSSGSSDLMASPLKRSQSQIIRPKDEFGPMYGYTSTDAASSYSQYLQPSHSLQPSNAYNSLPVFHRSGAGYQTSSPRNLNYGYSSSTASPSTTKPPSPQPTRWSGSAYSTVGSNLGNTTAVPSSAMVRASLSLSSLPSPAVMANPPLIRTSTLQQTPSPATTPHSGHPGGHYNAYSLYPNKAKLDIGGDLDALAHDWSPEEWESKRRIIHFKRSQSGSTITTTFNPVSADERPPHSICISCIYWEEKRECFVTSVDTIYLLEHLVAARFTVEEKNRIRRNLEGFRPLTVSKAKPDSEEFFKVIMGFPAPKPRNIEKDVKVFHWKDLMPALKKIIGKYSASPSSTLPTAPPLLTPVSSTGYATEGSAAGLSYAGDHHGAPSPRSISGSATSGAYNANLPIPAISPHTQRGMAMASGPADHRGPVPHNPHDSSSWAGASQHLHGAPQFQQLSSQAGGRGSWDMSPYLEHGGSSTPGVGNTAPSPGQAYQAPSRHTADTAGTTGDNGTGRRHSLQQHGHLAQQAQQQHQQRHHHQAQH